MPVQLSISLKNGELVKKSLEDLANIDAPKVSAGRLYGRLESARKRITRYPARFTGHYPWKSEKQRRYVMAAIRRGEIKVPYTRTGKYGRAWKVVKTDKGYMLKGSVSGRDYLHWVSGGARGEPQARIHQGRWTPVRDAVEEAIAVLPKEIADDIVMVARRRGFKAQ